LYDYPTVSKQLREYYDSLEPNKKNVNHLKKTKHHNGSNHHCCGFNMMEHGVGYEDLDKLLKNPKDLKFTLELVRVEAPGEYEKESWTLTDDEKIEKIPQLKAKGNELFKEANYAEACKKYEEAISYLEHFLVKEKPNDTEWNKLNEQKIPILLNYCLCKFNLKEYYSCIEHTTTILDFDPNNVKALFRRAKAHTQVHELETAKLEFEKCLTLDPSLKGEIDSQLDYLRRVKSLKDKEDQQKYKGKLF
jgi:AH receptor-interacting protein